jgi:hypothetical protein
MLAATIAEDSVRDTLFARVLAALIEMMKQADGLASAPDRHDGCIGDELGRHLGFHRPADDPPRG